ncbi:glycosyl hydrolase [Porphyrobacter algicida]|uniref:Glycosyl hydrolase n=2 Tax=Qipengyuania algicida TaxID=1836209 RepID=A0A845AL26_9SPHN|nr:glycosyl hydrolase [Qipengyuania algicida]
MLVAACAATSIQPNSSGVWSHKVAMWSTSADGARRLARGADSTLERSGASAEPAQTLLVVDPSKSFQSMVGFGAAMTDASAILFEQTLSRPARDQLFSELFGRKDGGIGLSFLRVPIGASDFSTSHYSLDDVPTGERDPALTHFSMAIPDQAQVPALRAVRRINPEVTLVASPWSAPAWMKTSDSLVTGHLRPDAYGPYAHYLSNYLDAMAERGVPIAYLTIQNEPHFEPKDYPGMWMNAKDRAAFDGKFLGPLLAKRGQSTRLLDWDHNWDHPEEPLAVLADASARKYVSGIAWHCYAGNVSAMEPVKRAYPKKDAFITECSGGTWAPDWASTLGWMTDKLIIAATRYGSRGTILWNLALDENNGPHDGGCGTCRGVVTINRKSGAITRNLEYYVLGQASRFVDVGAKRIESTEAKDLVDVAFRNRDGSIVLIVHNQAKKPQSFTVSIGPRYFSTKLPAGEIATYVWGGR